MNTAPILRLYLFFAQENDNALILRRSGKKLYNLIGWDRATDSFTEGQWIRRAIRADACDLSPDGQHFIYAVHDADPDTDATSNYTVISRAPWFTALSLFPEAYSWDGGGRFLSNALYMLHSQGSVRDMRGRASGLHQVIRGDVSKDCRTGLRLLNGQPAPLSRALREQLLDGAAVARDTAMDRYETQAGCLYRLVNGERELIRDFTDMEARFIRAPYDDRGQDDVPSSWHPLDAEAPR